MSNSTYSSLPKFHEAAADAPILLHRGKSRHYTACAAHDYFAVLCRLLGPFGQPIVDRSRPCSGWAREVRAACESNSARGLSPTTPEATRMNTEQPRILATLILISLSLGACGGGGSGGGGDGGASGASSASGGDGGGGGAYTVGGTVTGLVGGGLTLSNNGGDNLEVDANGAFTFTTAIGAGDAYSVTINIQPNSPVQACTVSNGEGSVTGANITTVVVDCARFAFVANSGSNNISAYLIDNTSGALTAVAGSPFASGANPSAVTFDPSGQFAYVVNAGSNNVSAYTINTTTGALTAIAGSPFATGTGPGTFSIDSSGDFAYLANHGSGNVSAFTINATTGALIAVAGSPFATGANPYSVTLPIDSFDPWAY